MWWESAYKEVWYHNISCISDLIYATIAAANRVAEELGMEPLFEEVEQERDMPMYLADVSRMARDLWEPRVGLRECVRAVKEGIRTPQDWMFE